MSKYLDAFRTYLDNIEDSIKNETNDHRREILRGYKKHACFEFGGTTDDIFTPGMTVDHPVYTVKLGRGAVSIDRYDGEDAVKGFYDFVNSRLVMFCNETLWVNDWGLASRADLLRVVAGATLKNEGVEVDDFDAHYAESTHIVMFWPYDENAKLLGEHIYQLEEPVLEKVAAEDMFTEEQRNAISAEYRAREI
jgi:hypothetical protein